MGGVVLDVNSTRKGEAKYTKIKLYCGSYRKVREVYNCKFKRSEFVNFQSPQQRFGHPVARRHL